MFKSSAIFLIISVILHHSPAIRSEDGFLSISSPADQDIQEAKEFSDAIIGTVQQYIQYQLPPQGKAEGEEILKHIQQGLTNCDSLLQSVVNIWEYKQCASALRRDAMSSLALLQEKYRPYSASSATRATLFW
ncbi:uncharacterized protein LOC142236469 [Haematobia irritans]|uniref:Putative secreted protein n=1 Tax=Haematobia irritans TaxID=7368 RepID=A0A1L8EAJ3_HAEIR